MTGPRTRATGSPLPLELTTDQLTNPRFYREWRNLQSEMSPPAVVRNTTQEMDTRPIYDTRRQVAPSTSTDPSLQHYREFTQGMMDNPEGAIFHETSVPMGRGIANLPTRPLEIPPTRYTSTQHYTHPTVALQAMSNPPSPRRVPQDPLDLPERPASARHRLVRYTTDPTIISHQRR